MAGGIKRYALKFISGKYHGGEFPLQPNKEIVVGRSSELDMVLVEDMVSRKHAKIVTTDSAVMIQDLGSTNGTFVNGEKVRKARLKEGDRILVGTSILKLVALEASGAGDMPIDQAAAKDKMERLAKRRARSSSPMSGRIDEVPLPDLLQLFSTSKKSGVMVVRRDPHVGKIYLRNGKIYYVSIDDDPDLDPQKAFVRMLSWEEGFFELTAPSDEQFILELDDSTEGLLMEAMRLIDEFKRIEPQCPAVKSRFGMVRPLTAALRDLNEEQLDVLQLVHNHSQVQVVLDKSILNDFETYQTLMHLIRKGYVRDLR
ncbi:MAG: FHA domain-containing protein [Deltaproteobacteria bacterium]|nr:FHA domain-containing protein [Deltaproteobacteria bacterium]